jgi:hypothetical protein
MSTHSIIFNRRLNQKEAIRIIKQHDFSTGKLNIKYMCNDGTGYDTPVPQIIFTVDDSMMYIDLLRTCHTVSGSSTMIELCTIARKCGIQKIRLYDESGVEMLDQKGKAFLVSYARFHILMYGISWYNKFGFFSEDFDMEVLHNKKYREIPFKLFIDMAKLGDMYTLFPLLRDDMTVSEAIFTLYKKYIRKIRYMTTEMLTELEKISDYSEDILMYSPLLASSYPFHIPDYKQYKEKNII